MYACLWIENKDLSGAIFKFMLVVSRLSEKQRRRQLFMAYVRSQLHLLPLSLEYLLFLIFGFFAFPVVTGVQWVLGVVEGNRMPLKCGHLNPLLCLSFPMLLDRCPAVI